MSKHLMQGWAVCSREITEEAALRQRFSSSTPAGGWLHTLLFWIDRSRQRKALGGLADLNNDLLKVFGQSQQEALRETAKPFRR